MRKSTPLVKKSQSLGVDHSSNLKPSVVKKREATEKKKSGVQEKKSHSLGVDPSSNLKPSVVKKGEVMEKKKSAAVQEKRIAMERVEKANIDGKSKNKKNRTMMDAMDKTGKKREVRAGVEISVARCHRIIAKRWKGKVSNEAAIVMATFLQFIGTTLLRGASESAEKRNAGKIVSSDVQVALTNNAWMRREVVKGRVVGAAPITRKNVNVEKKEGE